MSFSKLEINLNYISVYHCHIGKNLDSLPLTNLKPVKATNFRKSTVLVIKKRTDYPVTSAFPTDLTRLIVSINGNFSAESVTFSFSRTKTLKSYICFQASNINLSRLEMRITRLKFLRELDLSSNHIGSVPFELSHLESLEVLNLSNNELAHINDSIFQSNMKNTLKSLNLSHNKVSFDISSNNFKLNPFLFR